MTVPCKTCGKATDFVLSRECEDCRLQCLLEDAVANHGWTEADVSAFLKGYNT